jgi:hypothetical protein
MTANNRKISHGVGKKSRLARDPLRSVSGLALAANAFG